MKRTFKILFGILILINLSCRFSNSNDRILLAASNDNLLPLIDAVYQDTLIEKKTHQEIPRFIRSFLDSLAGNFLIANPGEEWQSGCSQPIFIDYSTRKINIDIVSGDTSFSYSAKDTIVPSTLLNYFGIGKRTALMKYYAGGIGMSEHILIFVVDKNHVIGFWSGGGRIYKNDATKEEILNFLRENREYWRLHPVPI